MKRITSDNRTIRIRPHERGLWFRRGEFQQVLPPGEYRIWDAPWSGVSVETIDLREPRLDHPQLDELLADAELREALHVVDVREGQAARVYRDGELLDAIGPGRHAYWKDGIDVEFVQFEEPVVA